jgi:ADP-heptose:LPS heptosyltransferase
LNPLASAPPADRILVVRLGALGDVLRTLPAVSSLRAGYPGAHIAWLVESRSASAVQGQPWVDELIVFPRPALVALLRGFVWAAAWREFVAFARGLRSRRFDLVVDFHSLARSALLALLSGAPRRVGYARPFGRELSYCLATDRVRLAPSRISRFERNAALVHYLGLEARPSPRPLRVDPAALARVEAELAGGPRPLALHPGTSDATPHKRWSAEGFARLARALHEERGIPSVVTWGPARDDRRAAEAVVAAARGAARLAPPTPELVDLAALLSVCRLYVGGDTGPMHAASLVGTPVVQLLGPTDPIENAPWPETPSRTVRARSEADSAGMAIEPEAVLAAARKLLDATQDGEPRRAAGGGR